LARDLNRTNFSAIAASTANPSARDEKPGFEEGRDAIQRISEWFKCIAHLVAEQLGLRDPTALPEEATSRRDTDARQIIVVFIGRPDTMGGLSTEVATLPRSI
jgi:hypothetical protein